MAKKKSREGRNHRELDGEIAAVYRFGGDQEDIVVTDLIPRVNLFSAKAFAREFNVKKSVVHTIIEDNDISPTKRMKFGGVVVPVYRLSEVIPFLFKGEMTRPKRGRPKKGGSAESSDDNIRLLRARADKAELELEEMKGGLHREADIIHDVGDMLAAFRAKIIGLPTKLVAHIPADLRQEAEANVRKDVNEALLELSQYRPKLHRAPRSDDGTAPRLDS